MFDLNNSTWDVDDSANELNASLFGSAQKVKKQKKSSKAAYAPLPDSDDEVYSKKGKRKLKEKNRKKKSSNKETDDSFEDTKNSDNESPLKQDNEFKKQKKAKKEAPNSNTSMTKDPSITALKKQTNKPDQENKTSSKTNENGETKKRKRKLIESESVDEEKIDNKKVKLGIVSTEEADSGEKKMKRKRKKKNNCRNNKYKHLALNKTNENCDMNKDDRIMDTTGSSDDENTKGRFVRALPLDSTSEIVNEEDKESKVVAKKKIANDDLLEDDSFNSNEMQKFEKKTKKSKVNKILVSELNDSSEINISPSLKSPSSKKKKKKKNSESKDPSTVTEHQTKKINEVSTVKFNSVTCANSEEKQNEIQTAKQRKQLRKSEILTKMLNESTLTDGDDELQNTKKPKNKNKNSKKLLKKVESDNNDVDLSSDSKAQKLQSPMSPANSIWGKSSILAREKLDSARFRFINEQLYKCEGSDAMKMFRTDKESFHVYHEGYRGQVSKWEVNPLDVIIKQFASKPNSLIVADFGCGEAKLAESVPQKVHSFDLVALNKRVTACDMSRTPLSPDSIDVAVFCLSLMGTNLVDYIREANRVLKTGGLLKIAEVTSRFQGVTSFITAVCDQGFQILNKRELGQMFYMMDFKKIKTEKKKSAVIKLNPCLYKRR